MNVNVKDGVMYNTNPESPNAKPIFSLGAKSVGDIIYLGSQSFIVAEVDVIARDKGRLYKRAVKAVSSTLAIRVLTNEDEVSFTGIWE